MASSEDHFQSTVGELEKEMRALNRKIERQMKEINELNDRIIKLKAETEVQADRLGSAEDERELARRILQSSQEAFASNIANKSNEITGLSEALKRSESEVSQLKENSRKWEQSMETGSKVLDSAFSALHHARCSEDAALESLKRVVSDRGLLFQQPVTDGPSPALGVMPTHDLSTPPGPEASGFHGPDQYRMSFKSSQPSKPSTGPSIGLQQTKREKRVVAGEAEDKGHHLNPMKRRYSEVSTAPGPKHKAMPEPEVKRTKTVQGIITPNDNPMEKPPPKLVTDHEATDATRLPRSTAVCIASRTRSQRALRYNLTTGCSNCGHQDQ